MKLDGKMMVEKRTIGTWKYTQPLYDARVLCYAFFLNALRQFTPLLNLCSLIFSLTSFGWQRSVTLIPYI